ncbi:MAG: hypothetical protein CMM52_08680 [Rhodospirillaceae bacterium]|nr:hypothetical protein [Rhodospirillaceae bacterium]
MHSTTLPPLPTFETIRKSNINVSHSHSRDIVSRYLVQFARNFNQKPLSKVTKLKTLNKKYFFIVIFQHLIIFMNFIF